MLRLQDEIVPAVVWLELLDRGATSTAAVQTALHELIEIRLPAPEIIIDVYGGNPYGSRAPLQFRDFRGDGKRLTEQLVAARKLKVIDHVDQEQGSVVVIRCIAV